MALDIWSEYPANSPGNRDSPSRNGHRLRRTVMHRSFLPILGCALVVLGFSACGSSAKSAAPATTIASNPITTTTVTSVTSSSGTVATGPAITISASFKFTTIPVKAGSKVTVRNDSDSQHTVSADTTAGGFDVTSDPGKTVTFTAPSKPGSYGFHCNIHNFMKATLTVT